MRIRLLLLFVLLGTALHAQEYYSYISDRRFLTPEELYGYDFKPNVMETIDGNKTKISPGKYSFAYSGNYLYVNGKDMKGVYSVNNIEPTQYGYKMNLMNARDPQIQGHLKFVANNIGQIESLIFKKGTNDQEIIFHLPHMDKKKKKAEEGYFTDRGEFLVGTIDSLWDRRANPFFRIQANQYRFQAKDSTYFTFTEEYKVIDKRKPPKVPKSKGDKSKGKKGKGKKGKKGEAVEEAVEEIVDDMEEMVVDSVPQLVDISGFSKPQLDSISAEDPRIKIEKQYFITLRTFEEYEDGTTKEVDRKFRVKKVSEGEDTEAQKGEDRFRVDFLLFNGKHIYVYLLEDRSLSKVEIGETIYLMRGH